MAEDNGLIQENVSALFFNFPRALMIAAQNLDPWVQSTSIFHRNDRMRKSQGVWETLVRLEGRDVWVPLIPASQRDWILSRCHRNEWAGHPGPEVTEKLVRMVGYWKELSSNVQDYVARCETCLRRNAAASDVAHLISKPLLPERPGQIVGVEFMRTAAPGASAKYFMTAFDHFTKYGEAYAVPDCSASTVARIIATKYIPIHGVPERLMTDRGTEFTDHSTQDLCFCWGIKEVLTASCHPKGNDWLCDRFSTILSNILAKIDKRNTAWEHLLPVALAAYRSIRNKTTGYTPNFLTFGREIRLPNDFFSGFPGLEEASWEHLKAAKKATEKYFHQAWQKRCMIIDLRPTAQSYKPGDQVYLRDMVPPAGDTGEHWNPWSGPWVVTTKHTEVTYEIRDIPNIKKQTVHINNLKPAFESGVPDGAFTAQLNHGESTETRPSNGGERRHAGRSVEHDQACTKSSRPGTSTQPVPIARCSINPSNPGVSPRPGTSTQPEPIASSSINPGNPGESPTISEFCDRITLPPDSPPPDIQTTMDPPPRHPQKRVSVDFQQLRKEKARKEKRKKK